ncbi:hypothetical protein BESB_080050 [Besnoitia besnoiti]|uniref:Uncharacterized protein n=1 Tax=Besnoitia besnoiti TaxID=94643 RepID=A0A2A9M765_BESBE|nr:hypothetical protein BESB_080050 [Besnoitia besnoiti]PFH33789.1 hypothetical protein BESB_080050 [Besnoitia besnoiti]
MALVAPIAPASGMGPPSRRRSLTPSRELDTYRFQGASSSVVATLAQQSSSNSRFYSIQSTPRTPATVAEAAANAALRAAQAAVAAAHAASIAADECANMEESVMYSPQISPLDDPPSAFPKSVTASANSSRAVSLSGAETARSSLGDRPETKSVAQSRETSCVIALTSQERSGGEVAIFQREKSISAILGKQDGRKPLSRTTSAMLPTLRSGFQPQNAKVQQNTASAVASSGKSLGRRASVCNFGANEQADRQVSGTTRSSSSFSGSSEASASTVALSVTPLGKTLGRRSASVQCFSSHRLTRRDSTSSQLPLASRQPSDSGMDLHSPAAFLRLGVVRQVTGDSSRMTSGMSMFMEDAAAVAMSLAENEESVDAPPHPHTPKEAPKPPKSPAPTNSTPVRVLSRFASVPALLPADEQRQKMLKEGIPPTLTAQDLLKLQRDAKKNFNSQTFLSGATLKSLLMAPDDNGSEAPAKAPATPVKKSFAFLAIEAARAAAAASPDGNFSRTLSFPEEKTPRTSFSMMEDKEEECEFQGRRRPRLIVVEDEDEVDIIAASEFLRRNRLTHSCKHFGDRCKIILQNMARLCW